MSAPGPTLEEIKQALAERSLKAFIRQAWHVVEPGVPYQSGRHIDAIADHLEAVTERRIRDLVINIPPRFAKSLIVCVFWPAWVWTTKPEARWLFSSYSGDLSTRDSMKCRRLIESPWYRQRWGHKVRLLKDNNKQDQFSNTASGQRVSTSVGGKGTGEGGDFVVVDDPHNVQDGESSAVTRSTCIWWDETMGSRFNNPNTGCRVIIMQRVSEKDLSAHVLAKGGYEHLCLPMEYESDRRCKTSIGWEDWRESDGELLWPERIGPEVLSKLKKTLGSYGSAGQLQQRPAPRGGGWFKREWFDLVNAAPATGNKVRYWDRAGTTDGDWTVGLLMSKTDGVYYVEHVARFQKTPMETERGMLSIASQDGPGVQIVFEQDPGQAGLDQAQHMVRQLAGYRVKAIPVRKNKELRAEPAVSQAEARNFKLVRGPWNEAFLQELEVFPMGAHDDQVDTFSGSFNFLSAGARILVA